MGDNMIGRFFADRIDGIRMEFYVYANGIIVCSMYPDILMKRIYLKPRIEYYGIDNKYHVLDKTKGNDCLICNYLIDPELFMYMKDNNMIMYSVEMAYLYDFVNKDGFDLFHKTTAFKRVKDKSKILEKQKKGIYN